MAAWTHLVSGKLVLQKYKYYLFLFSHTFSMFKGSEKHFLTFKTPNAKTPTSIYRKTKFLMNSKNSDKSAGGSQVEVQQSKLNLERRSGVNQWTLMSGIGKNGRQLWMDGHQATLIPFINIGFKNIRLLSDALKGRFDTLQICAAKSSHATASPKALRYKNPAIFFQHLCGE